MKRLKNTFFVTVLTVLTLLSFTSCEEDYRWVEGTIDYPADVTLSPSGRIRERRTLDESWIVVRGVGRYPDIRDVVFMGGQIDIEVHRGYVGELFLTIAGTDVTLPFGDLGRGITTDTSEMAQDFMYILTEEIRHYGAVDVIIEAVGNSNSSFTVNFGMDLDVSIRY